MVFQKRWKLQKFQNNVCFSNIHGFASFRTYKSFRERNFYYFLIWCFWTYLKVICKRNCVKRVQIQPSRTNKNLFGHFHSFSDLEFLVNEFFGFFDKMYFGKNCAIKGSNSALRAKKMAIFCPSFLAISAVFGLYNFFQLMDFSDFLIWYFWVCLEVICKKSWKKDQNLAYYDKKYPFLAIFAVILDLKIFLVYDFFLIFHYDVFGHV